jgi:excisionase family DNA binding protein
MENDSLMTIEEVAARLRVKKSWVYAHADDLGGYRLGKYLRFSWPRVLECLERRSVSLDQPSNDLLRDLEFTAYKTDREQNANKTVD